MDEGRTTRADRTDSFDGAGADYALVHLGSPENGFEDAGLIVPLQGVETITLGRAVGSRLELRHQDHALTIQIPLSWVSRRHARVQRQPARGGGSPFTLTDIDSRNGTRLDGVPLQTTHALRDEDCFEVGRSFWCLRRWRPSAFTIAGTLEPDIPANEAMRLALHTLERLAPSRLPLLLTGETGTGKSRLGAAMHRISGRRGPLLSVASTSVGSLAARLASSPAPPETTTLLIEDIDAIDERTQAQWMHVLQSLPDDLRILSTASQDLRGLVVTDAFRPDLYARLAAQEVHIPALRERLEDFGLLCRRLIREQKGGHHFVIRIEAFRRMLVHPWPLNVRELQQTFVAARELSSEDTLTEALTEGLLAQELDSRSPSPQAVRALRTRMIRELTAGEGNEGRAAAALGCESVELQAWLRRFELNPADFGSA